MTDEVILDWWLVRLRDAVQALALPAEEQVRLLPNFVVPADELALDVDNWWRCVEPYSTALLTPTQHAALAAIDADLAAMSDPANADLWTVEALHTHPRWEEVRALAAAALVACNWPAAIPPAHADEYIRGG